MASYFSRLEFLIEKWQFRRAKSIEISAPLNVGQTKLKSSCYSKHQFLAHLDKIDATLTKCEQNKENQQRSENLQLTSRLKKKLDKQATKETEIQKQEQRQQQEAIPNNKRPKLSRTSRTTCKISLGARSVARLKYQERPKYQIASTLLSNNNIKSHNKSKANDNIKPTKARLLATCRNPIYVAIILISLLIGLGQNTNQMLVSSELMAPKQQRQSSVTTTTTATGDSNGPISRQLPNLIGHVTTAAVTSLAKAKNQNQLFTTKANHLNGANLFKDHRRQRQLDDHWQARGTQFMSRLISSLGNRDRWIYLPNNHETRDDFRFRPQSRLTRFVNGLRSRIGARNSIRVHNAMRDFVWQILSRFSMPTPVIYELRRQHFFQPDEDLMNDSLYNKNTTKTIRSKRLLMDTLNKSFQYYLVNKALHVTSLATKTNKRSYNEDEDYLERRQEGDKSQIKADSKSITSNKHPLSKRRSLKRRQKFEADRQLISINGKEYYVSDDGELKELKDSEEK